ncbi:hypothetical protein TrST_g8307 [Triparma strigata]|uniref:OmpA-like domain-containing protein n=1 Tax=Triparma strigata TaxID=1606541 RepID=A0A9W7F0X7_9STRA|nr:hypothetical protein TrST_g8307 [Triparma strigata]
MSSPSSSSSPPVAQSPLSPPNRKYILTDDKFLPPPSPHEQAKPPPTPHEQGVCQQEEPCEAFSIFSQSYFSDLVFVHTMSFLGAVDLVQFSRVSKAQNELERNGGLAKWVLTEARKQQLSNLQKTGDLPLSFLTSSPNLERLHLIENPPRFPIVYFSFGSDTISPSNHQQLKSVASLLHKHPTLSILVEGRVQPDAPSWIKSRLSTSRAHSAALAIYSHLINLLQDSSPSDVLPSRLKFEGKGSSKLVNGNFENRLEFEKMEAIMSSAIESTERNETSMEAYRMWSQGWRRIDITVLGID